MSEYPEAADPEVLGEETGRFAASRIKALFGSPEEFQATFEEILSDLADTQKMSSEEREMMRRFVAAIAVGAFSPDRTGDDLSSIRRAIQNNLETWEHTSDPTEAEIETMKESILGPVKQRQLEMLRERGIEIPPNETPQPRGGPLLFGSLLMWQPLQGRSEEEEEEGGASTNSSVPSEDETCNIYRTCIGQNHSSCTREGEAAAYFATRMAATYCRGRPNPVRAALCAFWSGLAAAEYQNGYDRCIYWNCGRDECI